MSELSNAYSELLGRYKWEMFLTLTFRKPPHPEAAYKKFRFFITRVNRELYGRNWYKKKVGVYWTIALEYHKSGVIHFHALLGDTSFIHERFERSSVKNLWFDIAGFARVSNIPDTGDGQRAAILGYISKYVAKGGLIDVSDNLKEFSVTQEALQSV